MNTFSLQIRVKRTDGGLERILSVARRRRFDVVRMSVDASDDDTYFDVELTVRGERVGLTLVRQLEKLEDVSEVEIADGPAELAGSRMA
ncbi:MAG: ACT domain-containing protein [Candidatus Acidiferrales bacterium]